jgi:hypothetical protein
VKKVFNHLFTNSNKIKIREREFENQYDDEEGEDEEENSLHIYKVDSSIGDEFRSNGLLDI